MRATSLLLSAVVAAVVMLACVKNYPAPPGGSNPGPVIGPTPLPDPSHALEFRCVGDSNLVTIDYSTTEQGTTHLVTALPFSAVLKTTRASTFVSLRAAATGFGFLDCKVLVDGVVFQEANQTMVDPVVEVSGTWHQ